jgi:hypothetical protein
MKKFVMNVKKQLNPKHQNEHSKHNYENVMRKLMTLKLMLELKENVLLLNTKDE